MSKGSTIRNYESNRFISVIYTGGDVCISKNETFLACPSGDNVNMIDYDSGEQISQLEGDSFVVCITMNPNSTNLAMSCRSQNIIVWVLNKKRKYRVLRSTSPVISMDYDPTGTLIAFGQGDHTIKVYDVENNYITHHFKEHVGAVTLVKFHPNPKKLQLFTCSLDGIKVWDLTTRKLITTLNDHTSDITSITFSSDEKYLVTSSKDNVLNIYTLDDLKLMRTLPVFEQIESVSFIKDGDNEYIVTIGENSILKKWDIHKKETILETKVLEKFKYIKNLPQHQHIMCISEDNNFLFYDLKFEKQKHILGFNDEVLDISYIGKKDLAIVITNNEAVSIYDLKTKNTQLLFGHKDIALTTSCSNDGKYFVTGSKDKTIRVWETSKMRQLAIGDSHSSAVTSVCFAPNSKFIASVSDDKTLKVWNTDLVIQNAKKLQNQKEIIEKDIIPLNCQTTVAHNKDIGQVSISPDSKLISTASGDRTVKIWNSENLKMVNEFKHRSGVWSVTFSNVEKCIATGSADKLIRIWSLTSGTCLKIFEGHSKAILQVVFINQGQQLLTSAADGIIKLWNIKTNECVTTFDNHKDRVWAIDIRNDGREFISGGEDSNILTWKDNTKEVVEEEQKESDESILKDQEIQNLLKAKKINEAILKAIQRNKPKLIYELIQKVDDIDDIVKELDHEQMTQLFQYSIDWNTNSKFSHTAQKILYSLFKKVDPSFISFSYEKSVDALISYSKKHLKRVDSLYERCYFMDFLLANMKLGIEPMIEKNVESVENFEEKVKFVKETNEEKENVQKRIFEGIEQNTKKKVKVE